VEKIAVVLVGPQGSGKTRYCQEQLPDYLRISQDEQGRQGHLTAFDEAIARGEPRIVVDRINVIKSQRRRYLDPARQHGYRTRIVWLNADRAVCLKRCQARTDHPTLPPAEAEKALSMYFRGFQIPSRREADDLEIVGPPPAYAGVVDLCERIGSRRHIILGDVHGCFEEMTELLRRLGYRPGRDVLLSVGDIVDRGPKIVETVAYLFGLPEFHMVLGNHEHKLLRYLRGHSVSLGSGLESTVNAYGDNFPPDLADRLGALPLILKTPSGYVVHAGFDPEMPPEEQSESDCLFMRYHGGRSYFDEIGGRIWHSLWPKDGPRVFFGHIPDPNGPFLDHVVALDAGCVFGGALKAFDSRDSRCHWVPARQPYVIRKAAEATRVSSVEAVRRREEYVARGLLRSDQTDDGQLAIYTYTDQCTYTSAWDEITRNSRGHIFDLQTGECAAWPFPKFFNLGENAETLSERLPWNQPYEIYEKLDGWLGVLYRHDGLFKVASRGSFRSTGAVWATEFIQHYDLSVLPLEATLTFEIIHPDHQVIMQYTDQETLVVLGAFNRLTGAEYPRHVVAEWAKSIGLPLVTLLGWMSLEELQHSQKVRQQCEGFVLRFADGRRVKVKTDWYLHIAKVLANLTPISVWGAMSAGKVPDEYLMRVPEELRPVAEKYRTILEGEYTRMLLELEETAVPMLAQYGGDRKALAAHLNERQEQLGVRRQAVFFLLDGKRKRLDRLVMDLIYPSGNHFVADPL
jgi:RNA ligase